MRGAGMKKVGVTAVAALAVLAVSVPAANASEAVVVGTGPGQATVIPLQGAKAVGGVLASLCKPIEKQVPISERDTNTLCSSQSIGLGSGPSGVAKRFIVVPGVVGVGSTETHSSATGDNYALLVGLGSGSQ
jgi:hypothetical protein